MAYEETESCIESENLMPAIVKPKVHFDVLTYTGNGSTQTIGGLSFQPDFVWIKSRSSATDHKLTDSVRGVTKGLISNSTGAETTDTNGITAFTSSGFTLGSDSVYNANGTTYVAWCWKANGSATSNTAGSITSQVDANPTAGFSVVTFNTGTIASSATFGHGLGVAPKMVILKTRAISGTWVTYHADVGNTKYLELNNTMASATAPTIWNNTSPSSSVITIGSGFSGQGNYVAYCFSEVAGYSKFGSYTGNGSTDGTFVATGFRPRFVLIKRTDTASGWIIWDTARDTENFARNNLQANLSNAEYSGVGTDTNNDILSNGFKLRNSNADRNANGGTYIYMAFAETSQKFSLGR